MLLNWGAYSLAPKYGQPAFRMQELVKNSRGDDFLLPSSLVPLVMHPYLFEYCHKLFTLNAIEPWLNLIFLDHFTRVLNIPQSNLTFSWLNISLRPLFCGGRLSWDEHIFCLPWSAECLQSKLLPRSWQAHIHVLLPRRDRHFCPEQPKQWRSAPTWLSFQFPVKQVSSILGIAEAPFAPRSLKVGGRSWPWSPPSGIPQELRLAEKGRHLKGHAWRTAYLSVIFSLSLLHKAAKCYLIITDIAVLLIWYFCQVSKKGRITWTTHVAFSSLVFFQIPSCVSRLRGPKWN